MTDEKTLDSWRNSLRSRLNEELPRETASQPQRVAWLALHLHEYVERWLGFLEHPSVTTQPREFAVGSGVFLVIGIAAEVIDREMADDVPSLAIDLWARFVRLYKHMCTTHDLASRDQLFRLAEEFVNSLLPNK